MNSNNLMAIENTFINKLQIKETVALLTFSILIPYLMHFIPVSGNPAGAVLLPIFIAPFFAAVYFKWHTAVITALLSPMLNHLITGNPVFGIVGILTLELVLFVSISALLLKTKGIKYVSAPIALAVSIFLVQVLFTSFNNFVSVFTTAIPGVILLAVVNISALLLAKKLK